MHLQREPLAFDSCKHSQEKFHLCGNFQLKSPPTELEITAFARCKWSSNWPFENWCSVICSESLLDGRWRGVRLHTWVGPSSKFSPVLDWITNGGHLLVSCTCMIFLCDWAVQFVDQGQVLDYIVHMHLCISQLSFFFIGVCFDCLDKVYHPDISWWTQCSDSFVFLVKLSMCLDICRPG